jgi:hypothetical protein
MRTCAAFLALLSTGCAEVGSDTNILDTEVWAATASHLCDNGTPRPIPTFLVSTTALLVGDTHTVDDSAFQDMRHRNRSPAAIPNEVGCGSIRVVDSAALRQAIDVLEASPDTFYCVVTMSKPGYSPDGAVAVLYVDSTCSGGGGGDLMQFRKRNSAWQLERVERVSFA